VPFKRGKLQKGIKSMKWFEFSQNNSGGSFDVDDNVCHRLFIEAEDEKSAFDIAESKGIYFDGVEKGIDCECCGDRWSSYCPEVSFPLQYGIGQVFSSVEEYAQHLADDWGWTIPDSRIFYHDGKIVEINKKKAKG
jgi:hypothetical protein